MERKSLFILLGLGLLAILGYSLSLMGPFVYDDVAQIVQNKKIHDFPNLIDAIFNGQRQQRIFQNISFAFSWWLKPGSAFGFKIVNLILHLLNSVLLFQVLKKIFTKSSFVPLMSVGLFLIHPLQVQAVSYAMGLVSLQQFFFYFLILHLYIKNQRQLNVGIYALLFLSLLAKETCVLIPIVLAAYDVFIAGEKVNRQYWKKFWILPVLIIFYFAFSYFIKDPTLVYRGTVGLNIYPFAEHLLFQMHGYLFNIVLFFNHWGQSIIHPFYSLSPAQILLTLGVWCFALALLIYSVRSKNSNLNVLYFFVVLYFVALLPTNSVLQMVNPFAEYRLYQSNLSLFVGLAYALSWAFTKFSLGKFFKTTSVVLILFYFLFGLLNQNRIWASDVRLYSESLKNYPLSARLHNWVAVAYEGRGELEPALFHFEQAAQLNKSEEVQSARHLFRLSKLQYLVGSKEKALETLNEVPVGAINNGKPPIVFYKLKLQILKDLKRTQEYDQLLLEVRAKYSKDEFAD